MTAATEARAAASGAWTGKPKEGAWTGKSTGGHLGWAIFVWLIRHCGLRAAYALLFFVVPYYILAMGGQRRAQWHFHRSVRGRPWGTALRDTIGTFFQFSRVLIDRNAIRQGLAEQFQFHYADDVTRLDTLLSTNQPVIVVSAHVGAWDAGLPFFARFGKRVHVAMLDNEDPRVKAAADKHAAELPYDFLRLRRDPLENALLVKEALAEGGALCFMGDRYLPGAPTRHVDFFGRQVAFGLAPWQLAAAIRCPIIVYFGTRNDSPGYDYHLTLIGDEQTRRLDPGKLLDDYVRLLQRTVEEHPTQWFNFYDYFH